MREKKEDRLRLIDVREACPCGMLVLSVAYKTLDVAEPFGSVIGHLRRTGSLKIVKCEDIHA